MLFTANAKNSLSRGTLKAHISIGVFIVKIDTGSPVPNIPSKSRGLADKNKKKLLTEWKWFETSVFDIYVFIAFIWGAWYILIIDDQTVTVKCRTAIKPLFLYFNYSPVTKVRFLKI